MALRYIIRRKVIVMNYSIGKLAKLSHVSTRTLRYYDEIGLLKPQSINASNYRVYGPDEVDRLQEILFYRELELPLNTIRSILSKNKAEKIKALTRELEEMIEKRNNLDLLIDNIKKTIAAKEGNIIMKDDEKFMGFKKKLVDDNEQKYGKEIRQRFGDETVNASNKKLMETSKEEFDSIETLTAELENVLHLATKTKNPAGELAQKACRLHQKWTQFYWKFYDPQAHLGLVEGYTKDERFKAYYDHIELGSAEFLFEAMKIYLH